LVDPAHVVSAPIDIVIADDHAMLRAGLRLLLEADPGLHVVAEASDVDAALVHTRTHRLAVVLLDLNMPGSPTLPGVARDPVFRARFERECRLAAALDHPHVVAIFRAGEERGWLYLSMRYVDGTDLRSFAAA
jgi:DNA-binding NarL/FixJ family response regulator